MAGCCECSLKCIKANGKMTISGLEMLVAQKLYDFFQFCEQNRYPYCCHCLLVFVHKKLNQAIFSNNTPKLKNQICIMPEHRCAMCRNTQTSDPTACFHRIPKETVSRAVWMSVFNLKEEDIRKA